MPAILALFNMVPAWLWRWLAIAAIAVAAGGFCYLKGSDAKQAEWDASEASRKAEAAALLAIQTKGMNKATTDYARGVAEDAKRQAAVRAAVHAALAACDGLLPSRLQVSVPGTDHPPVPAVPAGVVEAPTGASDPAAIEEDISVTCPELRRRAQWLIDLSVAAGADKPDQP